MVSELDRLIELSEFDLDYLEGDPELESLARLAAKFSGAKVALINLLDRYSQFTIAAYGADIGEMPLEDSVCQFTIQSDAATEYKGLSQDPRFEDKAFVCGDPSWDYYYGIPLTTQRNAKIGALCVLDTSTLDLNDGQRDCLKVIADQVILRLESIKRMHQLEQQLDEDYKSNQRLSHDVRGPVSGIMGVVELLKHDLAKNGKTEHDNLLNLVDKSCQSILELSDSILKENSFATKTFTCKTLAEKLESLCAPQALAKGVKLLVTHEDETNPIRVSGKGLIQIGGNLINNAIKFTPENGTVAVSITLEPSADDPTEDMLRIVVEDTGVGISDQKIERILEGNSESEVGTAGERGYGFGLPLVRHLIDKANGCMDLKSKVGQGCKFTVTLPV